MTSTKRQLEATLADVFGYNEAVLFGRARSGVIALLAVLGLDRNAAFIMPSNLCSSMVLAVRSQGTTIELAGVSKLDGLASDETLVEAMRQASMPGVVMPTHLYGFVRPYIQTVAYARAHGWFILENDTIATKVRAHGAQRTAFGDALLVSFGYAKSIEAGGGGALLTDDAPLAKELRIQAKSFRPLDESALTKEMEFMMFERQLRNSQFQGYLDTTIDKEKMLFDHVPGCRYGFPEHLLDPLSMALAGHHEKVLERLRTVEMWNQLLTPFNEFLIPPPVECVTPWRLIRRVPGLRDEMVAALRYKGLDAGTNFPPLTSSFPKLFSGQRHLGAERWGAEVINLWVTPDYDSQRMRHAASIIEAVISNHMEGAKGLQ